MDINIKFEQFLYFEEREQIIWCFYGNVAVDIDKYSNIWIIGLKYLNDICNKKAEK